MDLGRRQVILTAVPVVSSVICAERLLSFSLFLTHHGEAEGSGNLVEQ